MKNPFSTHVVTATIQRTFNFLSYLISSSQISTSLRYDRLVLNMKEQRHGALDHLLRLTRRVKAKRELRGRSDSTLLLFLPLPPPNRRPFSLKSVTSKGLIQLPLEVAQKRCTLGRSFPMETTFYIQIRQAQP